MGRLFRNLSALVLVASLGVGPVLARGVINLGLTTSSVNELSDVVLQQVPLNITEASDTLEITWTPAVDGVLRYAIGSPGNNIDAYSTLSNPLESGPGFVRIVGNQLPVGQLTCAITTTSSGNSTFFQVLRASAYAPQPTSPISAAGGQGINTVTPTFNWQPVNGVPYYLIFVADQPFTIVQDEQGTRVEGANVVWQAITSQTSIQYGVPDPSGTIANEMVPPLVGSDDPTNRTRYNWTVLNCYGNSIEYTSSVTGSVAGFEVETVAPFNPPSLISPATSAQIYDQEILFQWSSVPQATSYLVYLSRFQTYSNGTEILFPVWRAQTTDNAVMLPAASLLQDDRYNWKVIAADGQGYGAMSDSSSFSYHIDSGRLHINTRDPDGNNVDLVQVNFEALDGPGLMPIATDDEGSYTSYFPVGTYILHGTKDGYIEAVSDPLTITNGGNINTVLTLTPQPSAITGHVMNSSSQPVSNATVRATSTTGVLETATTNLAGEFYLAADPGTYTLVASASGYESSGSRTVTITSGQTLDLADNGGPLVVTPYTYTLSGTVVNPSGQLINLAQVTVSKDGQTFSMYTGQSGQFSFTVGNGLWTLSAVKTGFYLNSGPQNVLIADEDVTETITLNPQAGIISGFVYIDGAPDSAPGLTIRATPSAGEPTEAPPADNGSFNIGVAPGTYSVRAVLDGYSADPVSLVLGPGQTVNGIQLRLTANPSTITGMVRTSSGTAIAQADVSTGDINTQTNASGVYQMMVPAGSHTITAQKTGYSTATSGPWTVGNGETISGINLTLSPNVATVSGTVSHGGTGIIGATVTATPTPTGSPISVTSGNGGTYSLGLEPGTYTLSVVKDGFLPLDPATYSLNLQPGNQVTGRNFSLEPNSGVVGGTVSGPNGAIFGATINVRRVGTTTGGTPTTSSVTGSFSVSVDPGYVYTVTAEKQGYQTATVQSAEVPVDGQVDVAVAMSLLGSSVSGRVLGPSGSGIGGATVVASSGSNSYSAVSSNTGQYTLSFPPGTYNVDISAPGHLASTGSVTTTPGQNRSNVNWTLQDNYASIAGQVTNGASVPNATIVLQRSGGGSQQATSDASGYYQFTHLVGGSYTATASAPGYASQTQNLGLIVDGQVVGDADFTMTPLSSGFSGTVTVSGTPLGDATVRATLPDGTSSTTLSENDGSYSLSGISSGTYTLEALKSGFTGSQVQNQSVDPGQTAAVDLTLVANNGQITGTVTDANGSTLSGAAITAQSASGHFAQTTSTPEGLFTISSLYPGATYTISATLNGFGPDEQDSVSTGDSVDLTLTRNALEIHGTTVNQAGTAQTSVPIRATSSSDGTVLTTTSSATDGSYTLTDVGRNTTYRIVTTWSQPNVEDADLTTTTGTTNATGVDLTVIQRTASISGNVGTGGVTITAVRENGGTRTTYSDAQGNYSLTGLRDGNWTLTPTRQGYVFVPAQRTVSNLAVGGAQNGITFSAQNATVNISGILQDDGGFALQDYTISLVSPGSTQQTTTSDDGSFQFTGVPGYTTYTISAITPGDGYEADVVTLETVNTDIDNVQLTVTVRLGRVSGTVVSSADNQPANPFYVQLDDRDPVRFNQASGAFSLNSLLRGTHTILVTKAGYQNHSEQFTLLTGTDRDTLAIALDPVNNAIALTISHSFTGSTVLVNGAQITLTDTLNQQTQGFTGGDGTVQFTGLDPEQVYSAEIYKPGFQTRVRNNLTVSPNAYTIGLTPAANEVFGTVRSDQGDLLENATVTLRAQSGEVHEMVTDPYGAYGLIAFDGPMTLIARAPGDQQTSYLYSFAVPSGDYSYRNLEMRSAAEIHGTVQTTNGSAPVSRALIETANTTAGTYAFLRASEDGTYRIRGLRPGEFTVRLTAAGYTTPDSVVLSLQAGEAHELNWTVESASTSITGRITRTDNGEGVAGAEVNASGPETLRMETTGDGDFGFIDIQPGDYDLTVDKYGYVQGDTSVSVIMGDIAGVNLNLAPISNQVSGTIVETDGTTPLPDVIVNLYDKAGTFVAKDTTDSLGRYAIDLDSAQTYVVRPAGQFSPDRYTFDHAADQGHPGMNFQRLATQGRGTVNGLVVFRDASLADVDVALTQIGGTNNYSTTTDADGSFNFNAQAPARYRLSATSTQYGTAELPGFELGIDSTITDTLAFASGQIGVTVVDENGDPVANNLVSISSTDGSYHTTLITGLNGSAVTSADLQNGQYHVEATPSEGLLPTAPLEVEIADGDSVGVNMPLGFNYTPPTVGNVGENLTVEVSVPSSYTIVSSLLYYRNVGENFFRSVPMSPDGGTLDAPSGPFGRAGVREGFRSLSAKRGPRNRTGGTIGRHVTKADGLDAVVVYRGQIPPQSGTGTLAFYPELITDTGLIIGGSSAITQIDVSNIGILSQISLTPATHENQPGVPLLMKVRALDAVGNNITSSIITQGNIFWRSAVQSLQFLPGQPDRVVYLPEQEGVDTIGVRVTQPINGDTLRVDQSDVMMNRVRVLGGLSASPTVPELEAGDSTTFTVSATDTGGASMRIIPEWSLDSTAIAMLDPIEYTMQAEVKTVPGFFGTVEGTVTDVYSGISARLKQQPGSTEEGLPVYVPIKSGPDSTFLASNGAGVSLAGHFSSDAIPGQHGQIFLRRPLLSQMQRFYSHLETLSEDGYLIQLKGTLVESAIEYNLTLPLRPGAADRKPTICKWDIESLSWITMGGTVTPDRRGVSVSIDPATQGSVDGLYAVIVPAKPLGIDQLVFNPNPFSPMGQYPLSIEFTLNSLYPDVWVSIDIFNMTGQHVRKLLDREPMPKGRFARDGGDNPPIIWDGLTDRHRMARNGRYIVKIVAEDADGRKEKVETVVLIK